MGQRECGAVVARPLRHLPDVTVSRDQDRHKAVPQARKVMLGIPARMTAGCRTPRELYRALNASTTLTAQTWAVRRLFDERRPVGWSTTLPR